jgi:predicted amidophosphoribosyltransferase
LASPGVYTELGQAEHDAKSSQDEDAIEKLSSSCVETINNIPFYSGCTLVCAVPPSPEKTWDLPTELAERIASNGGKMDVSSEIKFKKKKESVKTLSLEDKWKALEAADLGVSNKVNGRNIILVDDKYQSGTTAQFVASYLYQAGANEVHGLFCVKTWRDTDNT